MYTRARTKHSGLQPEYFKMLRMRGEGKDVTRPRGRRRAPLAAAPLQIISYTDAGRPQRVELGDALLLGRQLRGQRDTTKRNANDSARRPATAPPPAPNPSARGPACPNVPNRLRSRGATARRTAPAPTACPYPSHTDTVTHSRGSRGVSLQPGRPRGAVTSTRGVGHGGAPPTGFPGHSIAPRRAGVKPLSQKQPPAPCDCLPGRAWIYAAHACDCTMCVLSACGSTGVRTAQH